MFKPFIEYERKDFRRLLDQIVHPSENVFLPNQLKGRRKPLSAIRDCFETAGSQAFIWGLRGVGKTSLAHTSCEEHNDIVSLVSAVACERDTSISSLISDIVREIANDGKVDISGSDITAKLKLFGFEIQGKSVGYKQIDVLSVNHSADILATVCQPIYVTKKIPVIIIDEFDRLGNSEVKRHFTDLIKQLSAKGIPIKFIFCGTATSVSELLGQHDSAERYVQQIELTPLIHGALLEIIEDVENAFGIEFSKGQRLRITQISDGFAHFTHLILKHILLTSFESKVTSSGVTNIIYNEAIGNAVEEVADRLKNKYETATQKSSDVFIEVLWAAADGPHFRKQFKDISKDYSAILKQREDRENIKEQKLRNCLNALTNESHGSVLNRFKVGWYEFADPMLRSYARLVAENNGISLGPGHFKN